MIADGKIVAWFQGRMEFGRPALGNCSLRSARPDMRNILNQKVKHREDFRLFAAGRHVPHRTIVVFVNARADAIPRTSYVCTQSAMSARPL